MEGSRNWGAGMKLVRCTLFEGKCTFIFSLNTPFTTIYVLISQVSFLESLDLFLIRLLGIRVLVVCIGVNLNLGQNSKFPNGNMTEET
jgi:hypothetical protein